MKQRQAPVQTVTGEARTMKMSKLGKLSRRLTDLLRQSLRHEASLSTSPHCQSQHLWNLCRKAGSSLICDSALCGHWSSAKAPCPSDLDALLHATRAELQSLQAATCAHREKLWRESIADDWAGGGSKTYQWCKGELNCRADMIARPDGTMTCNIAEMDNFGQRCVAACVPDVC